MTLLTPTILFFLIGILGAIVMNITVDQDDEDLSPWKSKNATVLETPAGLNLSLKDADIPAWTVGHSASFDFKPLLVFKGEHHPKVSSFTWRVVGELPEGLTLDSATGVLSGAPKKAQGITTKVAATYKGAAFYREYSIWVKPAEHKTGILDMAHL